MTWLIFALLWGSLRLFLSQDATTRARRSYWKGTVTELDIFKDVMPLDDNIWTFGQFVAIIFLFIPWLSLLGDLLGTSRRIPNQHAVIGVQSSQLLDKQIRSLF